MTEKIHLASETFYCMFKQRNEGPLFQIRGKIKIQ